MAIKQISDAFSNSSLVMSFKLTFNPFCEAGVELGASNANSQKEIVVEWPGIFEVCDKEEKCTEMKLLETRQVRLRKKGDRCAPLPESPSHYYCNSAQDVTFAKTNDMSAQPASIRWKVKWSFLNEKRTYTSTKTMSTTTMVFPWVIRDAGSCGPYTCESGICT